MADTNTSNQPVLLQVPSTVKSLIEALIFGAREPLTAREIQAMYEEQGVEGGEPRKIDYEEIARVVEELNGEYASSDRPYRIVQIAGGYQFATLPLYAEWLGRLYKEQARRKLSQSSIETLAIIAYKQPITKPELESIRGVNCDYVIKTLLEKDLATIVGRASTVGRPLLYGTSKEFLRHFGLNDLNDLPRPREIQEILGDGQFETERRMLEAQQGLVEKKEEEFKSRLPHIPKRKAGLDDDVKILHKKHTREIKVRPTEETEVDKAEEVKETTQPAEASESPVTQLPQDQAPVGADETLHSDDEIPIIENEDESEKPSEVYESEADVVQTEVAEPFKYVELTPIPEGTTVPDEAPSIEPQPAEEMRKEVAPETKALEVEAASEITPMDIGQETTPASNVEVLKIEPEEGEVAELASEPSIEVIVVEESPRVNQPSIVDAHEDVIPQVDTPTIEEIPVAVVPSELQPSLEDVHGEQAHPHPKTRWKSWKEKIQGFIRKLFG